MIPCVTFVIPVRHQDNARDWDGLAARLAQTMRSIAAQRHPSWRGVVVANHGAALPPLPPGFAVERVSFPPNRQHDLGGADREAVYDAFRFDKGRRVLKGMLASRPTRFFMIVDDDDLVSAGLVAHAAAHPDAHGWEITRGYLWSEGRLLMEQDKFAHFCGTSLIVRSDLYGLPDRFEDADEEWIKTMLGSHVRIAEILAEQGTPLAALPFRGAVYRVGHSGAHSKSSPLLTTYLLNARALRHPRRLLRVARRFRWLGRKMRQEFIGVAAEPPTPEQSGAS